MTLIDSLKNKETLIAFINATVSPEDHIIDLDYYRIDDPSFLSMSAIVDADRRLDIEVQIPDHLEYDQKILYNYSKLHTPELLEELGLQHLKKRISISFLYFNYFDQESHYHSIFKLINPVPRKNDFEDLELHFIELKKFKETFTEIKTPLDHWLNILILND